MILLIEQRELIDSYFPLVYRVFYISGKPSTVRTIDDIKKVILGSHLASPLSSGASFGQANGNRYPHRVFGMATGLSQGTVSSFA